MLKKSMLASVSTLGLLMAFTPAIAGMEEAKKYVETEFQPSTLSKEDQMKEMEWPTRPILHRVYER